MRIAGWLLGRLPLMAILSYLCAGLVLYPYWWPSVEGPWAPIEDPRYVQVIEVMPMLAGTVALYAILPRLGWVDGQSPRRLDLYGLASALLIVGLFGTLPVLIRWSLELSDFYTRFVPRDSLIYDPAELADAAPYGVFAAFGFSVAVLLALGCLGVALMGRAAGPVAAPIGLVLLLIAQGWYKLPLFPGRTDHLFLTPLDIGVGSVVIVAGLAAFYSSAAGTRRLPLLARLRRVTAF